MRRDARIALARHIYARHIAHAAAPDEAGLRSALEAALETIPRERFLPPGPWQLARLSGGYVPTPDDDPVYLYQDVPVAIRPDRHLNNGQPSFLVGLIARGRPERGMQAVHVGTGTGYYTALLARLAGEQGRVLGIEHDPDLAAFAADVLAGLPQVRIVAGDGAATTLPPADLVLVNAGAARPAESWLDALTIGGRLILPLTAGRRPGAPITRGAVFLIERRDERAYAARCLSPTLIYPCAGTRDPEAEQALARALAAGGQDDVRMLHRTDALPDDRCWLRGPGWCLAYT
ncbi:protein-L-isoaspartate(D-aspartate) O-methyltransferase [Methylobacterium sp. 174MFSha1.1]|uniref:protein-L-isoaspartate O-methyltransferase family protein n=1 Tax=Methylobacterium sp. 174MFSha1.1 TaxID=1502749 RepID=UPI0008E7CB53|nr:protein-L-isoaspartate O-methyltransferase [Methylobacterium sp. 174MFSha1.1]SFV11350.1 protein-L-isoaspartate(D-aspartate) O-methyltransferase [Methylobacterium sp. 174MFSha1.1]